VIARDGCGVEQSDGVLGKRRDADEPQPRVELAGTNNDVNENGHPGRVQRDRGIRSRRTAQPVRDLHDHTREISVAKIQADKFARGGGISRRRHHGQI
jgi:hypothetical protein